MKLGPNTRPCIDRPEDGTPEGEARTVHAWESTGLHIVNGNLANTRRCVWCDKRQHKRYGRKGGWKEGD